MLSVFMTRDAFVSAALVAMTGEPPHVRQLQVYVAAGSKAAGARFVASLPHRDGGRLLGSVDARGLATAMGNDFDALDEAGLFEEPCVVVTARLGNSRVVRITTDGPVIVGDLRAGRYTPAGTVTVTLGPAAAKALRELLGQVPDTADTRELLDTLPVEIRPPDPGSGKS